MLDRSRRLLGEVHDEDREELIDLHERIEQAIGGRDAKSLAAATEELRELLFFIEGK